MPKLWEDTVESHRRAVRDAVLDAAWSLVRAHGLRGVTMSQVAAESGIGRATLYKYFPDVESILRAAHTRQVAGHVERLSALRDHAATPADGLDSVMAEFAGICFQQGRHGDDELFALLHAGTDTGRALDEVRVLFADVLTAAASAGHVRADIPSDELADYCLNALGAARTARDESAVERLVAVTADALAAR